SVGMRRLPVLLPGVRPTLPLIGVGFFATSFCLGLINGIFLAIVQTKIPQRLQGRMLAVFATIASASVAFALAVVVPIVPGLVNPLTTATGPAGTIVRASAGAEHGRSIALVYVVSGLAVALLTLATGLSSRVARFDTSVPDAVPDDLVGLQALRDRGL